MIHVASCPTLDYAARLDASSFGLTLSINSRESVASWLEVEIDEMELRRVLADFLYAKFRPVLLKHDPREARIQALLWLRQLLTNDGRFPPHYTPDSVVIVEPAQNAGPVFEV